MNDAKYKICNAGKIAGFSICKEEKQKKVIYVTKNYDRAIKALNNLEGTILFKNGIPIIANKI